jgi:tetratricopeptide (TPR) repeat protein
MLVSKSKMPKSGLWAAGLLALALAALSPLEAAAQMMVRASITIKDSATQQPIEGVKVTVVFKETNFTDSRSTNKKGQITFTLKNGPVDYQITLEKDGYNPATSTLRPVLGQVVNQTYFIDPLNREPVAAAPDPTAKLTPAEETFNQGVLELQEGRLAAAQAKFEEALQLDPKLLAADSALGGIHLENKDFAAAEASARKVVTADAKNPRGQRLLYEALRGQGRNDEAEEVLKLLVGLEKGGDTTAMLYNEGAEALRLGDTKTARERFEKVLELKPDLDQARSALMVIYIKSKEYAKAAETAEAVLLVKPNDVNAKRVRYDAYKGLGDAAKTKEAFDVLAAADPRVLVKGIYEEAQAAFNNNDTTTAMKLLDQLDAIDPNQPKALYLRGLCLVNLGRNGEARAALEKFLALAPNDPQAKSAREMLPFLK